MKQRERETEMEQKLLKKKYKRLTLEQRLELLPKFENTSYTQAERDIEVNSRELFKFMIQKLGIPHKSDKYYMEALNNTRRFNELPITIKKKMGLFVSYNVWDKARHIIYKNSSKSYSKLLDKHSYFSLLDDFFANHLREYCQITKNQFNRYNEIIEIMQSPINKREPLYILNRITKLNSKFVSITRELKRKYDINFSTIKKNLFYENHYSHSIKFIQTNYLLTNEKHLRAFIEFIDLRTKVFPKRSFIKGELSTYFKVAQSNIFDFLQDKEAYDKKYAVLYVEGKKYRQTSNM